MQTVEAQLLVDRSTDGRINHVSVGTVFVTRMTANCRFCQVSSGMFPDTKVGVNGLTSRYPLLNAVTTEKVNII